MANLFIKVINVDVETVDKGNGKSYEIAEVLFDCEGSKRTHKVLSFVNPAVFKTVKTANKGDTFEVNQIKNPQGYNQWNAITPRDRPSETNDSAASSAPTKPAGNVVSKSTYETADERAARQRLIVRQSSLSNAVEILKVGAKTLAADDVLKLAEQLTDWVFEKPDLFKQANDLEEFTEIPY